MSVEQITIIGMGLIGSSIARNIQHHGYAKKLVLADISEDVCEKVVELAIGNVVTSNLQAAVEDADMVVLAVPSGAMGAVAKEISQYLKSNAIVTDTGSVKQSIAEGLREECPLDIQIVPAHPIAGTEFSGPEAGFLELFRGRWCIITPLEDVSIRAVEEVTKLWEMCGAKVEIMDPRHHDLVLGITSHLPHLIAYTIVGTANDLEDDLKSEVIKFSASGFRDFTRIAASDPTMWRDIFMGNKDAVLEILQRFTEDLTALQRAIRKGEGDVLFDTFAKTRSIRREIIDQDQ